MARAIKLQIHVGKDRVVRLPSDFPEGPAEIIVTAVDLPAAAGGALGLWSDVADGECEAFEGTLQHFREADRLRIAADSQDDVDGAWNELVRRVRAIQGGSAVLLDGDQVDRELSGILEKADDGLFCCDAGALLGARAQCYL